MTVPRISSAAILWLAAAASAATGLSLMLWHWSGGLPFDATSGTWTALADDLAHGDFYRPLYGPLGWGGTRYMPLFFAMQAGLLRMGLDAGMAGLAVTVVSMLVFESAPLWWMRRQGVAWRIALPCVLLVHASIAYQLLTISAKGDILAAGLGLWGLNAVCCGRPRIPRLSLLLASLLFAGAALTKFTDLLCLATAVLWLALSGRRADGLRLAGLTALLFLGGFAAAEALSGGRMLASFAACASGGARWSHALLFPFWFARAAIQDPFLVVLVLAGAASAAARWRADRLDLPAIYFAATFLGTMLLFVSPGTDWNHFPDLLAAAAGLVGIAVAGGAARRPALLAAAAIGAASVLTWIPGVVSTRHFLERSGRPTRGGIAAIAQRLGPAGTRRLLSENPIVPLALGRRPELIDSFNLRLIAERNPGLAERFRLDLAARRYSAVVCVDWTGSGESGAWAAIRIHSSPGAGTFYGEVNFPPVFLDALESGYRLSFVEKPFVVFEPAVGPVDPPASPAGSDSPHS